MKKKISILLALVALLSGCAAKKEESASSQGCLVKLALICSQEENPASLQAFSAIERFMQENEIRDECYTVFQANDESEYLPYMTQAAEKDYSLIILPDSEFNFKQKTIASIYPKSTFVFMDADGNLDNEIGIDFKDEQSAFLAGVTAALKAKELGINTVGFIGGKTGSLSNRIQAGFEKGVYEIDAEMNILVNYTENLYDEAIAREYAYQQFEAGAAVIYHTTSIAGAGIINEAKERNDAYVIAEVTEQDQIENDSVVLASIIKNYDEAAYQAISSIAKEQKLDFDAFYAEFIFSESKLSVDMIAVIEEYKSRLKEGTLVFDTIPQVSIYNYEEAED